MDLENFVLAQSAKIDEIRSGVWKKKKEEEEMKTKKRQMNNTEVMKLIRQDFIEGLNKKELAGKHSIELGRVVKAIDCLKKDPEVIKEIEERIERLAREEAEAAAAAEQVQEDINEPDIGTNVYKSSNGRLTDDAKIIIAEEFEAGSTRLELANKYGVSTSTISKIVNDLVPQEKIKELNRVIKENGAKKAKESKEATKEYEEKKESLEERVVKHLDEAFKEVSEEPVVEEKAEESVEAHVPVEEEPVIEKVVAEVVNTPAPMIDNDYDSVKSVVENTESIETYTAQSGIGSSDVAMMFPVGSITKHLTEVKRDDYKVVGLINNRHNMGVNTYIFDFVANDKIFNFDFLENHVEEFIKNNIKFKNGVPLQGLIVKTTGLQTAIMALTKVCYNMKINLIISHHQITRGVDQKYRNQPIFTDFPIASDTPYVLTHIGGTVGKLFLFESSPIDFWEKDNFYEICIINRDNKSRNNNNPEFGTPISTYSIICREMNAMIMCSIMLQKIFSTDRSYFRTMKINEYTANAKNSIGYESNTIQRSYF